jgi:phage terminase Nu1 subunit (DNA packaging protein)
MQPAARDSGYKLIRVFSEPKFLRGVFDLWSVSSRMVALSLSNSPRTLPMKNKISVAELNVSQASLLTGKTRETVSRAARRLQSSNGQGNAKFFDSRKLLQLLYVGGDGVSYSEAMRRLALSRTALLDHELTERKAETVPIEEHQRALVTLIALFRSSLVGRFGKTVDNALLGSCQKDLYIVAAAAGGCDHAAPCAVKCAGIVALFA